MHPLSSSDIISELSYAYLYAVATGAGAACTAPTRLTDSRGIDATLTAWGNWGLLKEVDLKIQLKATTKSPPLQGSDYPYFLDLKQYDELRVQTQAIPRILVVLFLPSDPDAWLSVTSEQLLLQRAAYWLSLRDAQPSGNSSGETVYLPQSQLFTPEQLHDIFASLSNGNPLRYHRA